MDIYIYKVTVQSSCGGPNPWEVVKKHVVAGSREEADFKMREYLERTSDYHDKSIDFVEKIYAI